MAPLLSLVLFLQASAPALALQEQYCTPDAPAAEAIFGVYQNAIAVRSDDRVFVATDVGPRIVEFDKEGKFIRTIGGPGEGPGEFRNALEIGFLGDSLWVYDPRLARVSIFSPTGEFAGILVSQDVLLRLGTRFRVRGVLSDGRIVGSESFSRGPVGGEGVVPLVAVKVVSGPEGTVVDTLAQLFDRDPRWVLRLPSGQSVIAGSDLQQSAVWSVQGDGGGIAIAHQPQAMRAGSSHFTLETVDLAGESTLLLTVPFESIPLTRSLRQGIVSVFLERFERTIGAGVSTSALRSAIDESLQLPEILPPVSRLISGRDGTMWVEREFSVAQAGNRWDVFARDGTHVAVLTVPGRVTIGAVSRETAWGIKRDDLDVPSLCRFRVIETPG
jgi:hypothetical protein